MSLYSVLLVDDEEFVFTVMMKKMNWEEMGFTVVGYARNGVEALEKAEELSPDVVMTDIKMPYLDGLTLSHRLKEQYPSIKIIIFSGFDEFEYAKEAIKVEAEEYILKPIDSSELRDVFIRVKQSLDKELDEKRNIDKLQEHYINSLPILQDNFCISLIEGHVTPDLFEKYAFDYQLPFSGPFYTVCVLKVSYSSKNGEEVDVAPFLLTLSVQKLVTERLMDEFHARIFSYLGDVVVIAQLQDESSVHDFTDKMDALCKVCKRICNASVSAGIGDVVNGPSMLKQSYKSALTAISYRVFYGSMKALDISEVDTDCSRVTEEAPVSEIIKFLRQSARDEMITAIHDFAAYLERVKPSLQTYQLQIMKLSVALYDFIDDYHMNSEELFGGENLMNILLAMDSASSMGEYLVDLCSKLQNMVMSGRDHAIKQFVDKAEEYIKDNFANPDISVETICDYLSVSKAYFSNAFKNQTGKTFINYLTEYRMEHAKNLLMTTDMKTYEVAENVGYSDPNYFSYAFKKQFGISPSKYAGGASV